MTDLVAEMEAISACKCGAPKHLIPVEQRYWGVAERALWCERCVPPHVRRAALRNETPAGQKQAEIMTAQAESLLRGKVN